MKTIIAFILTTVFFFSVVSTALAAALELRPSTSAVNVDGVVAIDLVLNVAAGENVWGYEADILYPTNLLTYNSSQFVAGSVFTQDGKTIQSSSADKVTVGGYFNSEVMGTQTGGVVATLKFLAKAPGTALITIVCGQFTNVYATGLDSPNIFTNCEALSPKSTITIAAAGGATTAVVASPTPTVLVVATKTPTITVAPTSVASSTGGLTQLPETGVLDKIWPFIFFGISFIFFGIIWKKMREL